MRNSSFRKRLREAMRDDAVGAGLGGLGIPVPLGLLRALHLRYRSTDGKFLSLSQSDVLAYYHDTSDLLSLPWGHSDRTVPLQAVADWTTDAGAADKVRVACSRTEFRLDRSIDSLTRPALQAYVRSIDDQNRKPTRNDRAMRICEWIPQGEGLKIRLQPVYYHDTIRTNHAMDYGRPGRTLRECVHPDGRLQPLGETSLADHVGVDTVLVSSDGHLVVGKRSRNVAVAGGKLGPAGAGALVLRDCPARGAVPIERLVTEREMAEETTLGPEHLFCGRVIPLGISRDLLRGGKPQLAVYARSNLRSEEILAMWEAATSADEHTSLLSFDIGVGLPGLAGDKDRIGRNLAQVLETHGETMTEPLLGAVAFWWRHVTSGVPI